MINLLPPQQIQELKEERNFKILLHFSLFSFLFFLSIFLILFSIKIYLSGVLEAEEISFKEREKILDLQLEKEIKNYNELLKKIDSFQKQKIYFSSILEDVSKSIPENVNIASFSLELKPKEGLIVFLSGVAKDRETFLDFIKILKEKYANVSFSPESLLKQTEVNFSINFKIK